MEYKIKNASYVFWFFAVVSVIFSFLFVCNEFDSLAYYTFEDQVILYLVIAISCVFIGIALTLTLVSKALREITISTMSMLDDQNKNNK